MEPIPQAPEGLYTVIVLERDANRGGIASSGRAAFQVTGAGTKCTAGSHG
jgi:hypothetical protein